MNAQDQLAEMAAKSFGRGVTLEADVLDEYRAVLRWFAAEVERRVGGPVGEDDYAKRYWRGVEMNTLLRELNIGADDELNKRAREG